jgi:aspartyl-tRNA(Asn)/glutamyl-tRNA(Gln) amidotransferase subunit A
VNESGSTLARLTRPLVGLNPVTPQKWAGSLIDPPVSDPSAAGTRRAATAVAEPDDEPPVMHFGSHMRPTNFLGLPSLVVPAGQSKSGMPIGMQLIGRPFGDETLIALGRAFQAVTNHHRRVPALP